MSVFSEENSVEHLVRDLLTAPAVITTRTRETPEAIYAPSPTSFGWTFVAGKDLPRT